MKKRSNRWDTRAHVKYMSNKMGNRKLQHPQVRRQLDDMDEQENNKTTPPNATTAL